MLLSHQLKLAFSGNFIAMAPFPGFLAGQKRLFFSLVMQLA